ncbi:NADP-dependent oxidoreductase domain-containing protein [Panaeolus papilionaceus]|nr:NADP-dependent oxidoreductase domain-containing protein [Panaeolus papilionaceus]
MDVTRRIKLNNGVEVPIVGTGAWAPNTPEAQGRVSTWIGTAIKNGFRHIDTALGYGTEKAVGEAVRASGLPREEIFVTTKLPWNHHDRVRWSFEQSLNNLNLGYIDLYLMHWPQVIVYDENDGAPQNPDGSYKTRTDITFNETWAEMEKLLETGQVRAIGVSNFSIKNLEQLFKTAKIVPAMNQVELHPYLAQNALREYCTKKGIVLTAYTPSGYSQVRNDPVISGIAQKYGVTPNQITLAWHLSRDTVIVPKSEDNERQKENIAIPEISPIDLEKVWALDRGQRICNKPDPVHGQVWGWTMQQLGWEDIRHL